MGYTRYWEATGKIFTKEFVELNKAIVKTAKEKYNIVIKNGLGEGEPVINMENISINGDASCRLDCETFFLASGKSSSPEFCKTDMEPYDVVVNALLQVSREYGYVTNVEDNGAYNDEEAKQLVVEAKKLLNI